MKLYDFTSAQTKFTLSLIQTEKNTKLLNTKKSSFNLLEKTVYDIALFHFKRLSVDFHPDNHYIEFWWKSSTNYTNMHLDCDEFEKEKNCKYLHPICSSVTYFNSHPCPTVITPFNLEAYKFKEFPCETEIVFSFPRDGKHIVFDGNFFHGSAILDKEDPDTKANRYILAINLWTRKPSHIEYYDPMIHENQMDIEGVKYDKTRYLPDESLVELTESQPVPRNLLLDNSIVNFDFWEQVLYHRCPDSFLPFKAIFENQQDYYNIDDISGNYSQDTFIVKSSPKTQFLQKKTNHELIVKYGIPLMSDVLPILTKGEVAKTNRFYKHFVFREIYSPDICKWIIIETEKYASQNGGWTKNRHKHYPTTDIPADRIPHIFSFVLVSLETIFTKVKQIYCLPDTIVFDLNDIFLVKYDENDQKELAEHNDGSFISFNIMLSDYSEYDGGGTHFVEENETVFLNRGDMLLHSSQLKHAGKPLTRGTRYILVFFVNICI